MSIRRNTKPISCHHNRVFVKPGNAIATVAQPIARGIDYIFGTDIQNCQGCKGRQQYVNSIYDRFFNKQTEGITNMQFIVTRQIAVEAETPEEAVAKISEGQTISLSVNPRPQPPRPPQPITPRA
jgi:hypothetical protein